MHSYGRTHVAATPCLQGLDSDDAAALVAAKALPEVMLFEQHSGSSQEWTAAQWQCYSKTILEMGTGFSADVLRDLVEQNPQLVLTHYKHMRHAIKRALLKRQGGTGPALYAAMGAALRQAYKVAGAAAQAAAPAGVAAAATAAAAAVHADDGRVIKMEAGE